MSSELLSKIKSYKEIALISKNLHQAGKRIVMVTGCFDLFHFGHALFFEEAKKNGDMLIVSVGNDDVIKQIKGPTRPIHPQLTRAGLVASQGLVDFVVIAKEPLQKKTGLDYGILLTKIKPDFFILRNDDSAIQITMKLMKKHGGEVKLVSRERPDEIPYLSTSLTIEKIIKTASLKK